MRLLRLLGLALLCATLASCGSHPDPEPLTPLTPGDSALVLGDDLILGAGASIMQGFPNRLSILTRHRFINAGIPGATSAGLLQRLPFLLERFRPRLLLLCAGLADMKTGLPLDRTEWNLRQIVEMALGEGVSVVLIAVPERRYLFTGLRPMYHRIAREYGLWVEDKTLQKILYNPKFADEQYLLNSNGNRVFAEEMVTFLERTGILAATGTVKKRSK